MTPATLEGQTLGKYRVLEPLGRGGMAQVYKAYHPQLDRYVAVKVLRSDLMDDEEFMARFQREARAVGALRHPNIVQVYDFDSQDELSYMVMELLEGDTLKSSLNNFRARGQKMSPGEMVRVMLDVLAGLEYAHGEGIIHRDLKPANIMLTRRGQAVLTDFGIAQIMGGTKYTVSGALMGTLNYMAPEQGLEGRCDARSDLYSLGIVLFEMLTGAVPFDADTPLAILMKHLNDPLPMPHRFDPSIAPALESVIYKVLSKQPEDRYQNAAEMVHALKEAAEVSGVDVPAGVTPLAPPQTGSLSDSVAVFSGSARQQLNPMAFARDDTDTTLDKPQSDTERLRLSAEAFGAQLEFTLKNAFRVPAQLTSDDVDKLYVGQAGIAGGVTFLLVNMLMLWLGGMTGFEVFIYAWPVELALISLILCLMMAALALPWFLIPIALFLGNAIVMSYSAMTSWSQWICLWPVEPFLLAGSIVAAIYLAQRGEEGQWISRRLGFMLTALSALTIVVDIVLAVIRVNSM